MVEAESNGSERATIQAVAARAGVSPTTVSLVLAGKASVRRISEVTHRKVQLAAEELNYAPNLGTRTLRGARTHILSFFNAYRNRNRQDLYMNTLSSAFEAAGGAEGYDILVHCNFDREPKQVYQFLNGGLADGLLLFAPKDDEPLLEFLRKSRLPVVIVNGRDPQGRYSSVTDDVAQGMRLVADALVREGHREIAILQAPPGQMPDAERRVTLLRTFLAKRGIAVPDERILTAEVPTAGEALTTLRRLPKPPTAVFCWHDRLAYALLSACEEQGVLVPQELSVVGYDGLHWPSRSTHEVTSVKVDLDELASAAVHLLDEAILDPGRPSVHRTLAVSFLRGTSLGAVPNATVQIQ